MTLVVTGLAVAVAVLALLVAGLLRSHATILRRLHELGVGVERGPAPARASSGGGGAGFPAGRAAPAGAGGDRGPRGAADQLDDDLPRPPAVPEGREAPDLAGVGPRGAAVALRVGGTAHDTVLVFLSSGCTTCHAFWDDLRELAPSDDLRVVVITKGPDHESPAAVADVAPRHLPVVMASEAWEAYQVPGSPYVIHVDGPSGRVRGEGTGPTWSQVHRMLLQGGADLDARRAGGGAARKAAADAQRERDVDRMLLAAGIRPGDPSLYTRADGTSTEPPA